MDVRAYFAVCSLAAVYVLGMVAAVNYTVDVSGIYHTSAHQDYVAAYTRRLIASAHGLRAITFERALKLELARTVSAPCYVLGSSREMGLSPDRMPALAGECGSVANLGVSAGSYPDTLTQLAIVAKHAPTTVFIGISPWFFKLDGDHRWTEFADAYYQARHIFGLPEMTRVLPTGQLANLVNADYFVRNVEWVLKGSAATALPEILEVSEGAANLPIEDSIYRPDGSLTYSRKSDDESKSHDATTCHDFMVSPPFINLAVVREFAQVVDRLREKRVNVRLVMMPYHPSMWHCVGNTVPAMRIVEQAVREFAGPRNIPVIGSYNGERYGLGPQDFQDFMHLNVRGLGKINS